LTVALTPSILFSFFSMREAQEAHVIPPMTRSTRSLLAATVSGALPGVLTSKSSSCCGQYTHEGYSIRQGNP